MFFPNLKEDIFLPIRTELEICGAEIIENAEGVKISYKEELLQNKKVEISTAPYPDFPTDMQAQFAAMLLTLDNEASITENIFENRFMYAKELNKMGANIQISNDSLEINGKFSLTGAEVIASDLRASFSLVIAGLVATGRTVISEIHHLNRGYELLEENLANCGAKITREIF